MMLWHRQIASRLASVVAKTLPIRQAPGVSEHSPGIARLALGRAELESTMGER
jgi:hypothetical protein